MSTKALLSVSAVMLGVAGIAATFAPEEIAAQFGNGANALPIQLLGALYFAFAMANWAARGSLIGGIYNRPLALGNLTHFVVAGLAGAKAAMRSPQPFLLGVVTAYAVFAIAFAMVFVRSPVSGEPRESRPSP